MDHFIWTPILKFILVSGLYRKRRCLKRDICFLRGFRLNLEILIPSHVFSLSFNVMRIDDFMLLFHIKRLEVVFGTHCLHSVETSMFSLVISMDALWIVVSDVLVNHLSSSGSSHEVFIVFYKVYGGFF